MRAEISTILVPRSSNACFGNSAHAFVNVVVSMFSALEAGAGALTSRAQKMFPTTRKVETLMLSNCTKSSYCRERLGAGDLVVCAPKKSRTEHVLTDLIFDGCLLHSVHLLECLVAHIVAENATRLWTCTFRLYVQMAGIRADVDAWCKAISKHMFTCSSLRHIRFCGEQVQVN